MSSSPTNDEDGMSSKDEVAEEADGDEDERQLPSRYRVFKRMWRQ
jgi:hypothetical protein